MSRDAMTRDLSGDNVILSVVIPVYNEKHLVAELLRRVLAVSIPNVEEIEVLVVNDRSTDGTTEVLERFVEEHPQIRLFHHEKNQGKGAALRTGIAEATGDIIIFQDADLEYDPRDYAKIMLPFLEDGADVVYGSRFLSGDRRRALYFRHTLGNRFLTLVSNLFTDLNLTDMETCYKAFRAPLLKSMPLRSNDFAIEPEITAKVARRQFRIFEVPISYLGRTYQEGKKIGWRDGFKAFYTIFKYWLKDDLYEEDEYGSHILHALERTPRFNRWMSQTIGDHAKQGTKILEIGAGIGNMTQGLLPRDVYVASDINPNYLHYLKNYAYGKPYLDVAYVDLEDPECFEPMKGRFDTVICLNVLEHVRDPVRSLQNMYDALEPGGRAVIYVPQGQWLYSRLDEVLGHRCRYSREMLASEMKEVGFEIETCHEFNRCSVPGWFMNGRIFKRETFSRVQLKIFDILVPILRRIDFLFPWKGLGIVTVARKPAG